MDIAKKLEFAKQLRREMDSAIETLVKRDGLTRAAALDRVILSPEVSRAHGREREETEREEKLYDRVSKDAIKTADEAIDALAEQHRAKHVGMTHAQCVDYVITATEEGKRLFAESKHERLRRAALIT
jgi:hypothetical protein